MLSSLPKLCFGMVTGRTPGPRNSSWHCIVDYGVVPVEIESVTEQKYLQTNI